MDLLKLQNRIRAYNNANSFNRKDISFSFHKFPIHSFFATDTLLYPNAAIIIYPKSAKIALSISNHLADKKIISFVLASNILSHHLQRNLKFQKVFKNLTLISKSPNIAIPLISNCLQIYCPTPLIPLYNQLFPPENKQFIF